MLRGLDVSVRLLLHGNLIDNGETYKFFTDLDTPNRMDSKPFLVLDFADIDETLLPELDKLTKESFDLDSVISAADELKYIGQLKRILAAQFKQPEDEWVRFLTTRVYEGSFTQRIRDQFVPLVSKAARQFLNEQVNDRLKNALGGPDSYASVSNGTTEPGERPEAKLDRPELVGDANPSDRNGETITTEEELEAYRVVRAIVCSEVPIARIIARHQELLRRITRRQQPQANRSTMVQPLEEIPRNFRREQG